MKFLTIALFLVLSTSARSEECTRSVDPATGQTAKEETACEDDDASDGMPKGYEEDDAE